MILLSALCGTSDDTQTLLNEFDASQEVPFTHFITDVEKAIMIDIDQTLTDELKKLFEQTRKEMLAEEKEKIIDVRICVFMFQIVSPTISDRRLDTVDEAEIE